MGKAVSAVEAEVRARILEHPHLQVKLILPSVEMEALG
jgi:hypothetical protein